MLAILAFNGSYDEETTIDHSQLYNSRYSDMDNSVLLNCHSSTVRVRCFDSLQNSFFRI